MCQFEQILLAVGLLLGECMSGNEIVVLRSDRCCPEPLVNARQVLGLIVLLGICFGAAAVGSAWTVPSIDGWYAALAKPRWTPPNWLFGPVWTALYCAMAVAAWLVWRRHGWAGARAAMVLFAGQLALNVAWSGLFFGLKSPGLGLVDILLLWLAIAATLGAFWRKSVVAGLLLAPYLAWVTFAMALNYAVWQLNGVDVTSARSESAAATTASRADPAPLATPDPNDEQFRKLAVGTWQDDYQGKRTLTLQENGRGTMVVELGGLKAALVAPRLKFDIEWSVQGGRLKKRSLGGEPATQVGMILKSMGDTVDEPILELSDNRLVLLDADCRTRYAWQRVR